MPSDGGLLRTSTDSGINYVHSRSNSRARKDRKKVKRRSSSRRLNKASSGDLNNNDSLLNTNSSSDSGGMADFSAPDQLMTSMTTAPKTRASVPSAYFDGDNSSDALQSYAQQYVRAPPPEAEQDALLQSSANADPNDPLAQFDNFQDEFEDEMDEIEMNRQEKLSNFVNLSEMENNSKRRKVCRKGTCLACAFVLIAVVTGLVVWLVALKGDGAKKPMAVPEASKLLKLWCAEELDLGPGQAATFPLEVPEDCRVACDKADCCWNPNSKYECTQETEQYCAGYKGPCDIIVHQITSDTVPTAAPTKANTQAPQDQPTNQGSQNQDATPPGVLTPADETPEDQIPVDQTPPDEFGFPAAAANLQLVCSTRWIQDNGASGCQEECGIAECCWKVGTVNCSEKVENGKCSGYSTCEILNSIQTGSTGVMSHDTTGNGNTNPSTNANPPFPPAPGGLDVYCSPNEMEEISLHICQDKCEPAACCWNSHVSSCDASVPTDLCEPYVKSCAILNDLVSYPVNNGANTNPVSTPPPVVEDNTPQPDVPEPPSDFDSRCNKSNILGSANGGDILIGCEKDCFAASCCWQPNVDSCDSNPRCADYQTHCSVFVGLFEPDSTSGSSSGNSGTNSNSGGGANVGSNGNTGTSASVPHHSVPQAPSDLESICQPDQLTVLVSGGRNIVECEKRCLPASCCWKPTGRSNCAGAYECSAYMEPCGNHLVAALQALEDGTSIAQAAGTQDTAEARRIADSCDDQHAIFIKANCENVCRPGNCCFDDGLACSTGVDCSIYEPCGVLFRRNLRH